MRFRGILAAALIAVSFAACGGPNDGLTDASRNAIAVCGPGNVAAITDSYDNEFKCKETP